MLCKRLVTHIFTLKGLTSYQLDRTELVGLEGMKPSYGGIQRPLHLPLGDNPTLIFYIKHFINGRIWNVAYYIPWFQH